MQELGGHQRLRTVGRHYTETAARGEAAHSRERSGQLELLRPPRRPVEPTRPSQRTGTACTLLNKGRLLDRAVQSRREKQPARRVGFAIDDVEDLPGRSIESDGVISGRRVARKAAKQWAIHRVA